MNIDRELLRQVRFSVAKFIITLISGLLGGIFIIIQAYLVSTIISKVFINGQNLAEVMSLLQWLMGVILVRAAILFIQQVSSRQLAVEIKSRLRKSLYEKILKLGPVYSQEKQSGEFSTLAMQGIESLDAYFSQYLPQLVLAVAIPFTILATVFPMDSLSATILLLTAPLIPIFMILIGKSAEQMTKRQWNMLSRLGAYFLDTIQGLTTLKIYNSKNEREKISSASEKYRQITLNILRITFLSAFALEAVATLSTAIVAVQIGIRLLNDQLPYQQALFLLVLIPDFYLPLRTLGLRFHAGITGTTVSKQLFELLNSPFTDKAGKKNILQASQFSNQPVAFKNVGYTYPQRSSPAIEGVSFKLFPGKVTALIGKSGAGKTTIIDLLLQFIEPQQGEIDFGSQSIQAYSPEEWREMISWVPQTPFLFNTTLAANIHMNNQTSMERAVWAAQEAHLDSFIQELPEGYNTVIGEHGQRLSSGQAQRLALARAFYRSAPILLLDEPTTYIDSNHAMKIQDSIRRLCESRMTLIIAHHMDTISWADQLILLEKGRIVQSGDPDSFGPNDIRFTKFGGGEGKSL